MSDQQLKGKPASGHSAGISAGTLQAHTRAARGAAVCSALRAGTQHYVGIPAFLLFNPNSNGLVRNAAAFYYLSEKPRDGPSAGRRRGGKLNDSKFDPRSPLLPSLAMLHFGETRFRLDSMLLLLLLFGSV